MPVPVGGWGGRGRVSGCRQMGFLPAVGGVPSGPPAHLDMTELIDVCGGSVTADFQVGALGVCLKAACTWISC